MKAAAFDYTAPRELGEAIAALAAADGEARVIAGGQTLGPMLNLRLVMPALLVDVGRIAALKRIEERRDRLTIGAAVTHAMLEDRADPSPLGRFLARVASTIAYRAIRNRGTVGGSLAHADPAADWIVTMTLLEAELRIAGPSGSRTVPMSGFMRGTFATALRPAEVLEAIELPRPSADARFGYYKVCRKTGEFPDAIGAVLLDPARARSRIVAGALGGPPVALPALAARLARDGASAATPEAIGEAIASAAPGLDEIDLQLHVAAVRRAALEALAS